MNVGRYLRGEDRHVGTARTTQPQPPQRTEQEPVAWYDKHGMVTHDPFEGVTPLYLTPPQRKPLTHEQRLDLITEFEKHRMKWDDIGILIDLVEAAHDSKENT